nr:hypothetical protein CFP56_00853 [Quercus suber]
MLAQKSRPKPVDDQRSALNLEFIPAFGENLPAVSWLSSRTRILRTSGIPSGGNRNDGSRDETEITCGTAEKVYKTDSLSLILSAVLLFTFVGIAPRLPAPIIAALPSCIYGGSCRRSTEAARICAGSVGCR